MRKIRHPRALVLTLGAAALCAVFAIATADRATAKDEKAAPRPALSVTTARPATTNLPINLTANGSIAAWQEAIIGSESNSLRLA